MRNIDLELIHELSGNLRIIDDCTDLKIEIEASIIHICRTNHSNLTVVDECLCMDESFLILVYLDPCFEQALIK